MKKYELAVLLHPDLEIDQAAAVKKIEQLITDSQGKILSVDDWGKRKLAYPIKHQSFAIYMFYQIELPTDQIANLENALRITDEVIRHLIVIAPEIVVSPETEPADKELPKQPKE